MALSRVALAATLLVLLGGVFNPAYSQKYCKDFKKVPTQYNIALDMPAPVFHFEKSVKQLTSTNKAKMASDWATTPERKAWVEGSYLQGLASGRQAYQGQSLLSGISYSGYGDYCPFFKAINIAITYKTDIFIANDYKQDSCEFENIVEHEFRHHRTNQRIVQKYIARLKKDLPPMTDQMEAMGYVHYTKIDRRFEMMRLGMDDAIQIYNDEMEKEINRENAKIDTLEEYRAEGDRCRGGVDTWAGKNPYALSPAEFAMIPGGFGGRPGPVAVSGPEQEQTVVLKAAPLPDIKPAPLPMVPALVYRQRK
ncbi:MAG: hypothetical protein JWO78_764 [Micavibrio sp.]|nr:hypothetical protein [Micavibrio sp.]